MKNFSRALSSYEARFSRGPVDPTTHECTGCHYEVDDVDSHGHCDECRAAREAADDAAERAQLEADLASDEGFTAWCADRRDAGNEQQAREVDAFEAADVRGAA